MSFSPPFREHTSCRPSYLPEARKLEGSLRAPHLAQELRGGVAGGPQARKRSLVLLGVNRVRVRSQGKGRACDEGCVFEQG